ncbi:hypothetical protein [Mesorhizobium sp. M1365]|uniref:hypothetical protein n=1 Tax=Mesorhizobium sp. M1365 TaxID=2957090 RepID=UPI003337784B
MVDILIWTAFVILGFAILHEPIIAWVEDKLNGDDGHTRMVTAFHDDRRARGLRYQQRCDELRVREALAKTRRIASDRVGTNVPGWFDNIQLTKEEVISDLASDRPDLAEVLRSTLRDLSYGDILYPREAQAVDRLCLQSAKRVAPTDDQIAALRIVRPG